MTPAHLEVFDAFEALRAIPRTRLSGVRWMFSDIALSRARAGESKSAWAVFDRALAVAEDMDNAWARARALGKAASTLFELSKILSE